MVVIKRDGKEKAFELNKIKLAISKANKDTNEMSNDDIDTVVNLILDKCKLYTRALNVEEIQDIVEDALMHYDFYSTAKHYIKFRYQKTLDRKQNTTDGQILSTVNLENEEVKQENSNKNPTIIPTQRDYIAGLVSKDLTNRYLLPSDLKEAHQKGLIHFHDADYFITKEHNCDVWNLEDMLQNGTVINGVKIDKPHSFLTACTIATQIMAIVASCQYGGQTITLSHLAPFVDVSRKTIRKTLEKDLASLGVSMSESNMIKAVERRVKKEIKDGVQTIQYQILTLNSTNGQTPFVSLNMYLGEVTDPVVKADLALIIEEVLKQRIKGIKNEKGIWVTPAFPKLLYVLEEDNIDPKAPYYYLTELAAKCTAKRMVPDYISEKIMKQLKVDVNGDGNCYPCMGCVAGDSVVRIKLDSEEQTIRFEDLFKIIAETEEVKDQFISGNPNKYIDTTNLNLFVFDSNKSDFVRVNKIMRNIGTNVGWKQLTTSDGHTLIATENHIITTNKADEVEVKDITDDNLFVSYDNKLVECRLDQITDIEDYPEIGEDVDFDLV